jgi:hypothetical protein
VRCESTFEKKIHIPDFWRFRDFFRSHSHLPRARARPSGSHSHAGAPHRGLRVGGGSHFHIRGWSSPRPLEAEARLAAIRARVVASGGPENASLVVATEWVRFESAAPPSFVSSPHGVFLSGEDATQKDAYSGFMKPKWVGERLVLVCRVGGCGDTFN